MASPKGFRRDAWVLRALRAGLLALALPVLTAAGLAGSTSPAQAASAKAEGAQDGGYGRMVLTFDSPVKAEARISSGILVVTFDKPVNVQVDALSSLLSNYVSVVRRDPDGMAVRLALVRPVTLNVMDAGDKFFVDILPPSWKGQPPALPKEVLAELARRALETEKARDQLKRSQQKVYKPVTLQIGQTPTFTRLVFALPEAMPVRHKAEGDKVAVTFGAPVPFDVLAARAALPEGFSGLTAEQGENETTIRLRVPAGLDANGFREDDTYVLDLTRPAGSVPEGKMVRIPAPAPQPAPSEAAAPAPRQAEAPAPAPSKPEPAPVQARAPEPAPPKPAEPKAAEAPKPAEPAPRPADPKPAEAAKPAEPPRAADAKPAAAPEPQAPKPAAKGSTDPIAVSYRKQRNIIQATFALARQTPAAAFQRGSDLWVVFDATGPMRLGDVSQATGGLVREAEVVKTSAGQAVRLRLTEPQLLTFAASDRGWTLSLGDSVTEVAQPINLTPSFLTNGRSVLRAELPGAASVHWLTDPVVGDKMAVITAAPQTYSLARPREFVEVAALPSAQGLVVRTKADDVSLKVGLNEVTISRDGGLTISSLADVAPSEVNLKEAPLVGVFEPDGWLRLRNQDPAQANEFARAAASASAFERASARIGLAKFMLAHGNAADAKGILDVAKNDVPALDADPAYMLLRGLALLKLRRFEDAVKTLSVSALAASREAALWRAVAEAELGRIGRAREAMRAGESALQMIPEDLQRVIREAAAKLALEAGDFPGAASQLNAIDTVAAPEMQGRVAVLYGRVAEGMGQNQVALETYRNAQNGKDPIASAEARLRSTDLRLRSKMISRPDAIAELESLTTIWRGDAVEAEALAELAINYAAEKRWREAFETMRTALRYHSNVESTRAMQLAMTERFARLFLDDGPDAAPPNIESVALFYDFKELTPPGRRGDEMIRRLADRLVQVDLLEQAGDLLEYQIDNRLSGAARSQVAVRAAMIRLMDRKPAKAYKVLQSTRLAGLPADLVRDRLLLEARALADLGRQDLALEIVQDMQGTDADRMRADILWQSRRWQKAGEQMELLAGNRWQGTEPLSDTARGDVLRAAIAYVLSDDAIGLDRLRAKFGPKMSASPDARSFEVVTAPSAAQGGAFQSVANSTTVADTLSGFLEEFRKRRPENSVPKPEKAAPAKPDAPGAEKPAEKAGEKPDGKPSAKAPGNLETADASAARKP